MLTLTCFASALFLLGQLPLGHKVLDSLDSTSGLMWFTGEPASMVRFSAVFLVGSCFFLFDDQLARILNRRSALIGFGVTCVLMYRDPYFAEFGAFTVGALTLFWSAFRANLGWLQRINHRWDISYGVYLYAWPIADLIRWRYRGVSPWTLAIMTSVLAIGFGTASWWGLEKWVQLWSDRRLRSSRVQLHGAEPLDSAINPATIAA